eukprot:1510303-Rhodomonas_salina.1
MLLRGPARFPGTNLLAFLVLIWRCAPTGALRTRQDPTLRRPRYECTRRRYDTAKSNPNASFAIQLVRVLPLISRAVAYAVSVLIWGMVLGVAVAHGPLADGPRGCGRVSPGRVSTERVSAETVSTGSIPYRAVQSMSTGTMSTAVLT